VVSVSDTTLAVELGSIAPDWDEFVGRVPGGDLVQSTAWGRFREAQGFACHRVVARCGSTIVAGAQIYAIRIGPWRIGYVPYGPLVYPGVPTGVVSALVRLAREEVVRGGALFVQPPLHGEVVSAELARLDFQPSEVRVAPAATLRVDVSRPLDEVRAALSRRMRQYVCSLERSAAKVEIRRGDRGDLGLLAALHHGSARRQHFAPVSSAYLERLWDALAPGGGVELLIGSIDGQPVSADLFTTFGGVVHDRVTGFDHRFRWARVPTALIWRAIVDAHMRGQRFLDFGGIKRSMAVALSEGAPRSESWNPKHDFKLSFGAQPVVYPSAVELIASSTARAGYALARSLRPGRRALAGLAARLRHGVGARSSSS
jgi:lipid II:glycine glycyltransferase (peptidoglycan interpeptide bridge formation enzyme)